MNREEELWKQSLLSIPEENLFNLLRNYLGQIKTPYNKQNLITRLSDYLNIPQTKEKIISMISEEDATLLSLIFYKKGAGSYELQQASAFENAFLFRLRLSNLEERLLIYNGGGNVGKQQEFYINPLLSADLEEKIISPFTFLKTEKRENSPGTSWFSDKIFNPLFSFIIHNNVKISESYIPGNRETQLFGRIFSFLFPDNPKKAEEVFPYLMEGVLNLGLFNWEEKGVCNPNLVQISDFAALSEKDRIEFFSSAMIVSSASSDELKKGITLLQTLKDAVPVGTAVEKDSIIKSAPLFFAESGLSNISRFEFILDKLLAIEFFKEEGDYLLTTDLNISETHHSSPIIISSNFEATFPYDTPFLPEIPFLFSIEVFDIYSKYLLNKEIFYKAFLNGIDSKRTTEILSPERCQEIPQNIVCAMDEWEKEFRSLTLYEGITIIADEAKRDLIESIDSLIPFILEKPAPGIYIFSKWRKDQWLKILSDYDLMPVKKGEIEEPDKSRKALNFVDIAQVPLTHISTVDHSAKSFPKEIEPSQKISLQFEKLKKDEITPETIEALQNRIERKIILDEKQIDPELIPQEVYTVHFTDVNGKLRLIESALSHQFDILMLHCPSLDDPLEMEEICAYPEKIEKRDNGKYLVGQTFPEGLPFERKVNQIGKIVRKRLSLLS